MKNHRLKPNKKEKEMIFIAVVVALVIKHDITKDNYYLYRAC